MAELSEEQLKKKKKFLLMAPVIVIPFMTLIFWALGGGSGKAEDTEVAQTKPGINTELPGAKNKDDASMDKMGFYEQAELDSMKRREDMRNDPYHQQSHIEDSTNSKLIIEEDVHEKEVYEKLNAIDKELSRSASASPSFPGQVAHISKSSGINATEVDRLEKLLDQARQKNHEPDPETEQLNSMLEKILDIQHPDMVRERLKVQSEQNKGVVYPVYTQSNNADIHAKENAAVIPQDSSQRVIEAEIAETKEAQNNSAIKMRLLSDVYISGQLIPRNTFITGIVTLQEGRLQITVPGIFYKGNLFPVELAVYDNSGLKGLALHESVQTEIARQSTDRGVQSMNIGSLDPSIGAQAATAGIEMAKNIVSKKLKQIKVPVRTGQHVLLISKQ